jgi:hypothetical protein
MSHDPRAQTRRRRARLRPSILRRLVALPLAPPASRPSTRSR